MLVFFVFTNVLFPLSQLPANPVTFSPDDKLVALGAFAFGLVVLAVYVLVVMQSVTDSSN